MKKLTLTILFLWLTSVGCVWAQDNVQTNRAPQSEYGGMAIPSVEDPPNEQPTKSTETSQKHIRLTVELTDGSHLMGLSLDDSIRFDASFGKTELPIGSLKSLVFSGKKLQATATFQNGDLLTGECPTPKFRLTSLIGVTALDTSIIRRIDFLPPVSSVPLNEGLVLWNGLGSDFEIENSLVGPRGRRTGGRFVNGRFGQSLELTSFEKNALSFPIEILPSPSGCIEFWAKLSEFPADLLPGERPTLISVINERGSCYFQLHLTGNDGSGNGGVCFRIPALGSAGTGPAGRWTYARALGSEYTDDWHHYGFVWNANGIKDIADGTKKTAVFIDGKLNSHSWDFNPNSTLETPKAGAIEFMSCSGLSAERVAFDNLKIWNYPKTNFADRNTK